MTVYGSDATPLAWSGRPSELPGARIAGSAALLVAPGASGLRLVLVHPVPAGGDGQTDSAAPSSPNPRSPTGGSARGLGTEALTWTSAPVPVPLRPGYEGGGESRSPEAFVLTDLDGRALLEGWVPDRRCRGRSAPRSGTGRSPPSSGSAALFLAWLSVPLVAWRRSARSPGAVLAQSALLAGIIAAARGVAWIAVPLAGARRAAQR